MRSHEFGRRGEAMAAAYLESRGWTILERNWRFHHKEIDLVAARDGVVAFVEVKARRSSGWGGVLASIDHRKRRDLATAARGWIALHGSPYDAFRFDAVAICRGGHQVTVEHVEDAWRA